MTEPTTQAGKISIRVHYFIALVVALHSLFFLVYWFAVGAFRAAVDDYLAGLIGIELPYVTLVMALTALIFLVTLFRYLGLRQAVKTGDWYPAIPDWVFYVIWPLFLAGFYGAMLVLFQQDPSQRGVVRHLLGLSRLVVDALLFLLAAVWLRRLVLYLRARQQDAANRWPWTAAITLVLMALVGLWLVPTLFPPSWTYQGDLPTKPALIAHRGASMLAPENTLAAADLAASHQALGFETDLRISLDGVPFLMHDETLARTTNIAEVFPERAQDRASSFTRDEIKSLNAGLWFIQKDPFGTIEAGQVSQSQLSINQGEAIPTLEEALRAIKAHNMVIMFDMRYPPVEHPFYEEFFEIVLEQCLEARMNSDIWFLLSQEQLPVVRERAPQMTRVAGVSSADLPDVATLDALGYEIINVDRGIRPEDIRAYRAQGLGVNVYTVDEPWLFSQFWLSGVTSVTTNNVHTFNQLDRPVLNVPYARYVLLWGLFGIVVAIWLASSQPEPEPVPPEAMEPVNLSDLGFGPDVIVELPEQGAGQEEGIDAQGAWEDGGLSPGESEDSQPDPDQQS